MIATSPLLEWYQVHYAIIFPYYKIKIACSMVIFDFKGCSFKNLCNPIAFQSNAKKPQKIENYDYMIFGTKKQ